MNLSDIRGNIDEVDQEIRRLFLKRMQLAEQVVTVKSETGDKIFKPDREKDIILRNSKEVDSWLEYEYQALIRKIMEVSRKYQYGRMLELRDVFPFSYETDSYFIKTVSVLSEDHGADQYFNVDKFILADTLEEMGNLIRNHEADAGVAIMEEIGKGVNVEFHQFLSDYHFYINDCIVTPEDNSKKCVLFSDRLIVLPEHNRYKIMFTCNNSAGSYAGLLSIISDFQVNITEIHSSPFKTDEGWDYRFYLELEGNMGAKDMQSLIFQLSEETGSFEILGSYHCEGDFA